MDKVYNLQYHVSMAEIIATLGRFITLSRACSSHSPCRSSRYRDSAGDEKGRVFFWQVASPHVDRLVGMYIASYPIEAVHWQDARHLLLADTGARKITRTSTIWRLKG